MPPAVRLLSLESIEEGRFMAQANEDLLAVQQHLAKFAEQYGVRAKGAKTKLTLEITLDVMDPESGVYGVKATAKTSQPSRPACLTTAVGGENNDGDPCMYVRPSGSSVGNPRQQKLCTEAGEELDPDTGEIISGGEPDHASEG